METFEAQLLMSFEEGAISKDVTVTEKYDDIYYERKLAGNEVAEVTHVEVKAPEDPATLDPAGVLELAFRPDGMAKPLSDPVIVLSKEEQICPIKEKLIPQKRTTDHTAEAETIFCLGTGIGDAIKAGTRAVPCIQQTTLKFKTRMDVEIKAVTALTQPTRVNLYGYIYPIDLLNKLGVRVIPTEIYEPHREVRKSIMKMLPVNADTWSSLPGGSMQDKPEIYHMVRKFVNTELIEAKKLYQLNYHTDKKVAAIENELYWYSKQIEDEVIVLKNLGVRYHADLDMVAIEDSDGKLHPSRGYHPALMGYGWAYGLVPGRDLPKDFAGAHYYAVPQLYIPFSIGGLPAESGGVVLRSKVDIAANVVKGVAIGKRVLLK